MGLLDKVKNLFTDEEIIEEDDDDTVSIHEIKKEDSKESKKPKKEKNEGKLPTFMREKLYEEEEHEIPQQPDFTLSRDSSIGTRNIINNNMIAEEEKNDGVKEELISEDVSQEVKSTKDKFKFPMDFSDDDFVETRARRSRKNLNDNNVDVSDVPKEKIVRKEQIKPKVADLYKDKKPDVKKEEKRFRATPIISPVYGVLDRNYQNSQIQQGDIGEYDCRRPSKNVDFDSVRKKAYGSLSDDIKDNLMCENCEYKKEVKNCRNRHNNDNGKDLMYDIMDETNVSSDDITIKEASENYYDYGSEYKRDVVDNGYKSDYNENYNNDLNDYSSNLDSHIDNDYNNKLDTTYNLNSNEEVKEFNTHKKKEVPPVKSKINLLSTLKKSAGDYTDNNESSKKEKDLELTDDLFNIIDSMYEERNDK